MCVRVCVSVVSLTSDTHKKEGEKKKEKKRTEKKKKKKEKKKSNESPDSSHRQHQINSDKLHTASAFQQIAEARRWSGLSLVV